MIYGNKRSFAKGELSPAALSRSDVAAFDAGACRLENFIVLVTGGITRSPGTRFVAEAKTAASKSILVPFVFSTAQAYVIEIGSGYARFYIDRGRIEVSGAPYEIATPWNGAQLRDLTWVQEADILYLFHPSHEPRKLSRFGHTDWRLSTLNPDDGPFLEDNPDQCHTVTASATSGSTTLTASGGTVWEAGDVGSLFRLGEAEPARVQPWEPSRAYDLGDQVRFDGNIYELVTKNGDSGSVPPIHTEGRAWDGKTDNSMEWSYLHSGSGVVRITGFISPTEVTGTVLSRLPDSVSDDETWRWASGAWSAYRGYPGAATFADQRLITAATVTRPMSFWGSVGAGNYERFEGGVEADKGFSYTLASAQVNAIRWLINAPILLMGSSETVWLATGTDFEAPLSPAGVRARPATQEGSAALQPVAIGNAVIYLSRNLRRLYELTYDGPAGTYSARDLTLLSDHIARP